MGYRRRIDRRLGAAVASTTIAVMLFADTGAGAARPARGTHVRTAQCTAADVPSQDQDPVVAAGAITCLINAERARHGLGAVAPEGHLGLAAARHSVAMLRTGVFDHQVPGEPALGARVRATGYLAHARRSRLAEALACGTDDEGSPDALVAALLHSPPHRAILLDPAFREFGVGLVDGIPGEDAADVSGVTLTLTFGRVRRR